MQRSSQRRHTTAQHRAQRRHTPMRYRETETKPGAKGRMIWRHGMLGGRSEVEGKGGMNLYIIRACGDVWKGTRQLVYKLTILSFSPSLSLSLYPALCGLFQSHSVSPSIPFGIVLVSVPFGLCLGPIRSCPRVRSIRTLLPLHSV